MRSRFSGLLLVLATLGVACSGSSVYESGDVAEATSGIVNGTPSTEEEDFVVDIETQTVGFCTGTVIAPNVVLTALHCVSDYDGKALFSCDSQGRLTSVGPGGGVIGELRPPKTVQIRVGPASSKNPPDAYGAKLFGTGTKNICVNDVAVIVTDRDLSPPPREVRIGARTSVGELLTAVGYGQDENGIVRIRNRRTGVRVSGVGAFGQFEAQGTNAPPRTFIAGQGPCHGDSGGPAISEATGAVVGVYSSVFSDCTAPAVRNVYTQVAAFAGLLNEAMEYAGAELLVEPPPVEPSGGTSGLAGAAGSDPGGRPPVGGAGGRGGAVNEAGTGESEAGVAGTRVGTGSGSRQDATCACRMDALSNNGAPWAGVASLLFAVALRRRRR